VVKNANRGNPIGVTIAQVAGLFTVPMLAGIGAAAVSIPIIIHLMARIRRRPEAWGAMRFLIEAYRKQRRRMQIEKLLLLLVRCLAVLVAGLALAGPVLSGCSSDGLFSGNSRGRLVYIVIDNALSSQTREAGTTRLDALKQEAIRVVDEMGANDRAVVLSMARPSTWVIEEPAPDVQTIKKAISSIEPGYSRGELMSALIQVNSSIQSRGIRAGEAVVVLLSDFPASSKYFEQPLPPELEGLGERARIVTSLPPEGTENLQVMSLEPRRGMVVAESTGATVVSGRVVLRRFGGIGQARVATLAVSIESATGELLASSKRAVQFPAGERERGVNFDLPLSLPEDEVGSTGRELVVRAALVAESEASGVDVLSADDRAAAIVRVRGRLQVALIDDEQDINPNAGELEPWQWLRAALTPEGLGAGGSFELGSLLPTAISDEALESFDAAVVLRPDELTVRGWQALEVFAARGGLVWVFPPALDTEPDWAQAMKRAFNLPWEFGDRLVKYEPAEGESKFSAGVDQSSAPPQELQFLAADWREKLGWLSVTSWLPVQTDAEDRWITLDTADNALPSRDKPVLMAYRSIKRGSLVFTAAPLDTRFTNLPIRALFVPLMHDTLRGVLGSTRGDASIIAGDQPELGPEWRGVGELTLPGPSSEQRPSAALMVRSADDGVSLQTPALQPGIYQGSLSGAKHLLAVNPDSSAGDTVGGTAPLERLLGSLGRWSYLSDQREQGGILSGTTPGTDLTRALLWVLLGLIIFETFLARWFSHATDHSHPTVISRLLDLLHGHGSSNAGQAGGAK